MPKKNTTTPAPAAPGATVAPTADTPALAPAAQIVLAQLHTENATTAADLSDRCGLARSTVTKALATLLDQGLAMRQDGGHDGARRIADRWFSAPATLAATDDAADTRPGADAPGDNSNASAARRADSDGESAPDRDATDGADSGETTVEAATVADGTLPETTQAVAIPAAENGDTEAETEDGVSIEPEADGDAVGASLAGAPTETGADAADGALQSEAGEQSADEANAASEPEPAPVTPHGEDGAPRLGKGALRAMVEAHLRENPGRQWTPTAISKALGRSAGAINNACMKLTESGTVTTFDDKPIRFQWNGAGSADAS